MWLSRHEDAKHATQDSSGQWKQYNLIVRNATSRNDEMTFAVMVTEMGLETVHAAASVASAPYYCGRAHWLKITTIACSSSSSSTSCHCHCYSLGHYRHRYRNGCGYHRHNRYCYHFCTGTTATTTTTTVTDKTFCRVAKAGPSQGSITQERYLKKTKTKRACVRVL